MKLFFTDYFGIAPETLEGYGAFNVSLINDLPLFIDPFLLFTSDNQEYKQLHDGMIAYLQFLRDMSGTSTPSRGVLKSWYYFQEVRQLWLGFSLSGNRGLGSGRHFAESLHRNLKHLLHGFGAEEITRGSHVEKVCLIDEGTGRDKLSDFTAALIKRHLAQYTQQFARDYLKPEHRRTVSVDRAYFNYDAQVWCSERFELPWVNNDYVILTPKDILTKDESWINRCDFMGRLPDIANSAGNDSLRESTNRYLVAHLKPKQTQKEKSKVYADMVREYPELIEWYILAKENAGGQAIAQSQQRVAETEQQFNGNCGSLVRQLAKRTKFYRTGESTIDECLARVGFLKEEIENNGAYRLFYHDGKPVQREPDLQIMFRLTWYATPSDFNSEVNNGRGPVDFKASRGAHDKTIVEFKLAKNSKLEEGLTRQVPIYEKANRTKSSVKVIFSFSEAEQRKVEGLLKRLKLDQDRTVVHIDCRADNKPSASHA